MTSPTDSRPGGSNRRLILLAAIAAAVVVAVALWYLFGRSAPEEASVDNAAAQITADSDSDSADSDSADSDSADSDSADSDSADSDSADSDSADSDSADSDSAAEVDIEGDWSVDTSIGEFSFEDSSGTFVGFRVEEVLTVGDVTAVGRTPDVSGSLSIEGDQVTMVSIEAEMTSLVTNEGRRDSKTREAIGAQEFPTATFVLTEPITLPKGASSGKTFPAQAVGELTVKGATNPVTVDLEVALVEGIIVVVGSTEIVFADYGVTAPTAPVVVSVEDHGIVELQLFFTR